MLPTLLVGSSETLHNRRPNHHPHNLQVLLLKRPDTGRLFGLLIRFCVCEVRHAERDVVTSVLV